MQMWSYLSLMMLQERPVFPVFLEGYPEFMNLKGFILIVLVVLLHYLTILLSNLIVNL